MARHQPYLQAMRPRGSAPERGTRRWTLLLGVPVVGFALAVLLIASAPAAPSDGAATFAPLNAAAFVLPEPTTVPAADPAASTDPTTSAEPTTPADPFDPSGSPTAASSITPSPCPSLGPSPDAATSGTGSVEPASLGGIACTTDTGFEGVLPVGDPTPRHEPGIGAPPPPRTGSLDPEELTGYRWPLYKGRITSFFAPRETGFLVVGRKRIHQGLDIATYCGDEVKAAHPGRVVAAGRHFQGSMGFDGSTRAFRDRIERRGTLAALPIVVIIDDGNGYYSLYVHLSAVAVKVGRHVRGGDVIGWEGDTGNATGCHLHYELARMDGRWMRVASGFVEEYSYPRRIRERVDPLRVLDLRDKRAPAFVPGIEPPKVSPGLGRSTVRRHHRR